MNYKLGSLFDGSGGFPLSGALCGVEPVWAAEVEPYPIAVTRSRFPKMKHLGDISKVSGAEIEPVDIITFGSPCQDLSVAGKRAGLKHEANGDEETTRSGLFMEAVRIIKEMRKATNGKYPRFALWENVPGAFSSNKGEDFRIVCEELIKIVEPSASMPPVPKGGWNYADYYRGDGWSLAYRVLDAQYWGVPQRRRRIYLVADLRGERAREVLFEREGLRGYFTQGRTPWQETPADAESCTGADDREGETAGGRVGGLDAVGVPYTLKIRSGCEGGGKGALIQEDKSATLATNNDQYLFQPVGVDIYNGIETGNKAATLTTQGGGTASWPSVVYAVDQGGGKSGANVSEDRAPTLCTTHGGEPAVAYSLDEKMGQTYVWEDQANTLAARDYKQPQTVVFSRQRSDELVENKVVSTQSARQYKDATDLVVSPSVTQYWDGGNTTCALTVSNASGNQWRPDFGMNCVIETANYIVRRLTPTECARLQGFADWWGVVEQKQELTEEEYLFWMEVRNTHAAINGKKVQEYTPKQMLTWYNKLWTDSAEYKMWGNGIALPTALYCIQGAVDALSTEEDLDDWMN